MLWYIYEMQARVCASDRIGAEPHAIADLVLVSECEAEGGMEAIRKFQHARRKAYEDELERMIQSATDRRLESNRAELLRRSKEWEEEKSDPFIARARADFLRGEVERLRTLDQRRPEYEAISRRVAEQYDPGTGGYPWRLKAQRAVGYSETAKLYAVAASTGLYSNRGAC